MYVHVPLCLIVYLNYLNIDMPLNLWQTLSFLMSVLYIVTLLMCSVTRNRGIPDL